MIPGLKYIPDYVTQKQHDALLEHVDMSVWSNELKRRVQHYGYKYDYKLRSINESMKVGDLPPWATEVTEKLVADKLVSEKPDQLIVNEYVPGQGISYHVDCVPCFKDTIISLSLGSAAVMEFMNLSTKQVLSLILEPRGLLVLEGEARYGWMHRIPARREDDGIWRDRRVSLTFRNVIL